MLLLLMEKKKPAHAYFKHRCFLSFLAGKFATFEQMLLTELIKKKLAHASFKHPYFFLAGNFSS